MTNAVRLNDQKFQETSDDILDQKQISEKAATQIPDHRIPGETENMAKAQEVLQRAISPNLRNLEREQALQDQIKAAKTAEEKFPLVKDLFKLKTEAFKSTGESIEEFSAEALGHLRQNGTTVYDYGNDFKNKITSLCFNLCDLSQQQFNKNSLQSPALQLFELEKTTGFSLFGPFLLLKEFQHDFNLLHHAFHHDPATMEPLYWNHVVPHFHKILNFLENEKKLPTLIFDTLKKGTDILNLCSKVFSTSKPGYDPFHQFFPLIVKYFPQQKAELIFKDRVKNVQKIEKSIQWINLHCKAAEILATTDLNKAIDYLTVAENELKNQFWTYPFPFNNPEIEKKRKEAKARIEQAYNTILIEAVEHIKKAKTQF